MSSAAAAFIVAGVALAPSVHAAPIRTERAACAMAKARVAAQLHRARSSIPGCEGIIAGENPRGFYIVGLHGWCREAICGSTLIGWYAVQKRTGRVFTWDVGEWSLGKPIS